MSFIFSDDDCDCHCDCEPRGLQQSLLKHAAEMKIIEEEFQKKFGDTLKGLQRGRRYRNEAHAIKKNLYTVSSGLATPKENSEYLSSIEWE